MRLHQHTDRLLPGAVAFQRGHVPPAAEQGVQEVAGVDRAAEFSACDEGAGAVLSDDQVRRDGAGGVSVGRVTAAGDVEAVLRGSEAR